MRALTFISFGILCSWWLLYAPVPDLFRAGTSEISESRAQRSEVSGLGERDRPLTPLRCVRGLHQFDQTDAAQDSRHRSPIDLALIGDGRLALVANHTADSVSLVDLEQGKVLAEQACGRKPVTVAVSADGKRAAVSNLWFGSLTLLAVRGKALEKIRDVPVGALPRGLVFARDSNSLYAALAGQDEVIRLDWATGKVIERWPAPREPRHLGLSRDGKWLAAASSKSAQVRCWNLQTGKLHWQRDIGDAFNLRGLAFTPQDEAVICAHVVRRDFPVTRTNIEEGWVIDSRLTRLALKAEVAPAVWQMALDIKGRAVGDPHGLAFAPTARWLALTASGTQELLLLDTQAIPWNAGDPGDFLDPALEKDNRFRRISLGGRPMALAFRAHADVAVIANYLLDAVQIVDVQAGKIVRTIPLGSAKEPGPARQGEALFYDARRSHNQWFSCHTCHVDGHTCGLNFDTLNDDSYGTPKLTPSLHNVTRTGPWTWHGRQKDLGASIVKSLTTTMFGPKPTPSETTALLAFLETLAPPPNPHRQPAVAVRRGEMLFNDKARCSRCHSPPYFTSPRLYDVQLEAEGSPYKLWNPPSLLGLYDRGPYLHDGRAKTLDEVLQKHHTPDMLGGQKLTDAELSDLKAFLLSL
jgi:cytochrome c peroxidase